MTTKTTKDLLQEILNEQKLLKGEIVGVRDSLQGEISILREEMRKGFKETNARIDKLGKQLAYLEFDALKKQVRN